MQEVHDEQGAIPDDKPDELGSGLMCFIREERECGPSCMAFMPQPADVPLLSIQQRHCVIIVSTERIARHAVIGVKLLSDAYKDFKKSSADQVRANQKPPETPR